MTLACVNSSRALKNGHRLMLLVSAFTSSTALAASSDVSQSRSVGAHKSRDAAQVRHPAPRASVGKAESIAVTGQTHGARLHAALQRTPASISLLTGERLRQLGVTDVRQLANLTPNLYEPRATVGFSATNYFIRGIGELDPQGEPSVGTYIDGVYLPRTIGTMQELLDVDNVQIDRGPVGFTAGHQAEGGAVRINTVAPGNTRQFRALVGYGSYNEYRAAFLASGALVKDRVYASLAFDRHGRDGFDRNYTLNQTENNIDYTQARGKLRFTPNDRWDITLAFDGTVDGSTNRGYGNLLNGYTHGLYSSIYPKNNYSQVGFTGNVNYVVNSHLQLHSTTAVRGYDDTGYYDNYGTKYIQRSQLLYYKDRAYSEDLNLHGDYGRLSFTVGAYFMYEDWYTARRANNTNGAWYPDSQAASLQSYTPVYAKIDQLTRIWALYGQAEYKITPTLTATVGLRFNHESHSNAEDLNYLVAGGNHSVGWPGVTGALYSGAPGASAWPGHAAAHADWTQLLPKGALTWQITPSVMPYVSISQGSKSGGYDYRAQTPGAANMAQALLPYKPELVTTFEIGAKTSPLAHILEVNGALFWNNFNNIQMTTYDATTALSHRFNAGKGHSAGAEMEATAHIGSNWDMHYTASYLYAQLDHFDGVSTAPLKLADGGAYNNAPHSGARLPYSPRWQMNASVFYRVPLRRAPGRFSIGADVSWQSSLYLDGNENAQTRLSPQTYFNAIATWTSDDRRWTITGQVRNILDRRYPQTLSYTLGSASHGAYSPVNYAAAFADPRTIFVTAEYKL
ncbi:TonB-dependent receptor [Acetobacter nitrogenifigens]|uniref:TonB-dependent receptor n=1 Tax=Acetobacter nitrogenifigens TaxID=285268 RepID=UPI000426717E|nr:TonB-dependent receptor [Acetobacter nitrogenifigens]